MSQDGEAPVLFKKVTRVKKNTRMRFSLPEDQDESSATAPEVYKPKKSLATRGPPISQRPLSTSTEHKSMYSADYLKELRQATPTIPRNQELIDEDNHEQEPVIVEQHMIDGGVLDNQITDRNSPSGITIPDESVVRHMIEQRDIRRRAGENFIPLSDALDISRQDATDTAKRIQTEDAVDMFGGDGTEGLEGFEDDRLHLGTKAQARADREKRIEMEDLVRERQDLGDEDLYGQGNLAAAPDKDTSDSDDEWERTQVCKSGRTRIKSSTNGVEIFAPELLPIPSISVVMQGFERRLANAKTLVQKQKAVLEQLESQLVDIADQEEAVKAGLQSATLAFETAELKIEESEVGEVV